MGAPSNRASKRRAQRRSSGTRSPSPARASAGPAGGTKARAASEAKGSGASAKRRRAAPPPPARPRWPIFVGALVLLLGFAAFYQFHRTGSPATGPTYLPPLTVSDPATLPGIQTGPPPWTAGHDGLRERLRALGLPALGAEGTVLHTHEHLDVFVHGKRVTVPARSGSTRPGSSSPPLHTHDASGVIHVESPTERAFSLGEFFDVWGVLFTRDCIGGPVHVSATTGCACSSTATRPRAIPGARALLPRGDRRGVRDGRRAAGPIPESYGFPIGSSDPPARGSAGRCSCRYVTLHVIEPCSYCWLRSSPEACTSVTGRPSGPAGPPAFT